MENCKKQAVKDEKEKAKYYHRRFRYSPYSVPKRFAFLELIYFDYNTVALKSEYFDFLFADTR